MDIKKGQISMLCQALNTIKKDVTGKDYANAIRIYETFFNLEIGYDYKRSIDMSKDPLLHKRLLEYKKGITKVTEEEIFLLREKIRTKLDLLKETEDTFNEEAVSALNDAVVSVITNGNNQFDFYKK
jgi:hypothetical protein